MDLKKIKTAFERQTKAVTLRPGIGCGTAVTRVTTRDGLTCDIEEGPWKLVSDGSEKWGGNNLGPTPGTLARAALGSCLAQAYVFWAARYDMPLDSIDVEIHTSYDTRGLCGVSDDVPPSYITVRYVVVLHTEAPDEEVNRVVADAEKHCPILDVFARAQNMEHEITVSRKG